MRHSRVPHPDAYDNLIGWDFEVLMQHRDVELGVRTLGNSRGAEWRLALMEFFAAANSSCGVGVIGQWLPRRNPEQMLFSNTLLGLCVQDAFDHLAGDPVGVRCAICRRHIPGRRRRPSRGQKAYCDRRECRATRQRLNQARYRARREEG